MSADPFVLTSESSGLDDGPALRSWEVQALLRWFMHRISQEDRARLMRDLPDVYNRLCGRQIVRVVYADDGSTVGPREPASSQRWTVVVPFVEGCPTKWHPTDRDFAPLTRGAFASRHEANEWAKEHLAGHPYEVRAFEVPTP